MHLLHFVQPTYLQHKAFLRKPPAAHAGTQVRLQHLTLQATGCPHRDPGALATPDTFAANKLTCNTTPSPTRPSHCLARKCTSSDLSGKHLMPPAAHTGTQVRWLHLITLQATSCPRRDPGALATNSLLATQHLPPQATSCPRRDPGALATPDTASRKLPKQGPRFICYKQITCNTTPDSASHQLPAQRPRCTCYQQAYLQHNTFPNETESLFGT